MSELTRFDLGLQRFRPRKDEGRVFTYRTWSEHTPLPPLIAAPVACCATVLPGTQTYGFRLLFRTKYLEGFLPAVPTRGEP